MKEHLLEVKQLHTNFYTNKGVVRAVDGVSFWIDKGTTLAVVGESGCGKSVSAMSILNLVEKPGKIEEGAILWKGQDITVKGNELLREIRGNEIAMVFQEPMTSLNPVFKIEDQIAEALILHRHMGKKESRAAAAALLKEVGIPRAEEVAKSYPHELSGGMRQRVMIAMALSCSPELLIADEPTTALDVTIAAQILSLMRSLQQKSGMAMLFITHDLGVVAQVADYVAVMYAGILVEYATVKQLFYNPMHPYTKGLLASIPQASQKNQKLYTIPGQVPDPFHRPKGCPFYPRCSQAKPICQQGMPLLAEREKRHTVRCYLYGEETQYEE